MRKRIGSLLIVTLMTVTAFALPAHAKPIVEPMRPAWLVQAQEWRQARVCRQRPTLWGHSPHGKARTPAPKAEHAPLPPK